MFHEEHFSSCSSTLRSSLRPSFGVASNGYLPASRLRFRRWQAGPSDSLDDPVVQWIEQGTPKP